MDVKVGGADGAHPRCFDSCYECFATSPTPAHTRVIVLMCALGRCGQSKAYEKFDRGFCFSLAAPVRCQSCARLRIEAALLIILPMAHHRAPIQTHVTATVQNCYALTRSHTLLHPVCAPQVQRVRRKLDIDRLPGQQLWYRRMDHFFGCDLANVGAYLGMSLSTILHKHVGAFFCSLFAPSVTDTGSSPQQQVCTAQPSLVSG